MADAAPDDLFDDTSWSDLEAVFESTEAAAVVTPDGRVVARGTAPVWDDVEAVVEDVKPPAKNVKAVLRRRRTLSRRMATSSPAMHAAAVNFMPLADVVEAVVGDVKPSAEQLMNAKPRASGYYRVPSMFNGAALAATVTGSADDCNVDVALESYKAHQLKYAMATKHSLKHDQERKKFESSLIESLMGPQIEKPPVI